jgi:hypothetical protein
MSPLYDELGSLALGNALGWPRDSWQSNGSANRTFSVKVQHRNIPLVTRKGTGFVG